MREDRAGHIPGSGSGPVGLLDRNGRRAVLPGSNIPYQDVQRQVDQIPVKQYLLLQ